MRWMVVEVIRGWESDGDVMGGQETYPKSGLRPGAPCARARVDRGRTPLLLKQTGSGSLHLDIGHRALDIGYSLESCHRFSISIGLLLGAFVIPPAMPVFVDWRCPSRLPSAFGFRHFVALRGIIVHGFSAA